MKYLKLQNKGLLDLRLLSLMGGTTKSKDEFKIGQWGSGLKYTLAYLLKNNVDFKVFIGEQEVNITTHTEIIRDEEFEIILVNGEKTSITTQMGGKAWEPWMIIRELWCNCLDEGEPFKEVTQEVTGKEDTTTFFIQVIPEIREVLDNWDHYFIHELEPMSETPAHKIYKGGNALRLYKQGVLIYEDKKQKSLFSYDIRNAEINELREFKGTISYSMVQALAYANEKVISYFLENITDQFYEGLMDYDWYVSFSDNWKKVIGSAKLIHPKAIETIQARGLEFDYAECITVPEKVFKFLTAQFNGVGALRTADKVNEFYEIYDQGLETKVKQAQLILEECGYFIHPELKFVFGAFGDKRVLAKVNLDSKEVLISEAMKNKSMFCFIGMLIEENEHFNTGFSDHTREFQQHFIDLYTKSLLDSQSVFL